MPYEFVSHLKVFYDKNYEIIAFLQHILHLYYLLSETRGRRNGSKEIRGDF